MWQATVYVTELRDFSNPIFRAEASHEDPKVLMPYLLEQACREPVMERMRHLNVATDGLSVVLYLARADSQRTSSPVPVRGESPPHKMTSARLVGPSSGPS